MKISLIKKIVISIILGLIIFSNNYACTDIIAGKKATIDGSVITSHTGAAPECRVHVVHGKIFKAGEMAPVYFGLQDVEKPLYEYGEIIGYIPQVEKTYTYFHSGYSHMNEFQLAIGESTMSQKKELCISRENGKQIMTIEQAQAFALQRCKTAREAIKLITFLIDKYGFLPSCGPNSEALCIADPNEAWVLEVFSIGPDWDPESGKAGAIWAAQRVPDDHIAIVPNWSIIKQIDLSKADEFMASENYKQVAIDFGWYNPNSGKPFIWQEVYSPIAREWAISRFWLFLETFAPNFENLPDKTSKSPFDGNVPYTQYLESVSFFPFSIKPEKKVSVQDIIAFQRSVFKGTIYDMTLDKNWQIPGKDGKMEKSPLATPFPTKEMRKLLDITYRRMVSRGGYGMVSQLRSWLPDPIGGVYWFYVDNQYVSTYVPIYAGVQNINEIYKTYDPENFSENSARWLVDFVDNLMYLKWQEADKDLKKHRDPLEKSFFDQQAEVEKKAVELFKKKPKKANQFLTEYTDKCMLETIEMYRDLRKVLITKYTNNKQGL